MKVAGGLLTCGREIMCSDVACIMSILLVLLSLLCLFSLLTCAVTALHFAVNDTDHPFELRRVVSLQQRPSWRFMVGMRSVRLTHAIGHAMRVDMQHIQTTRPPSVTLCCGRPTPPSLHAQAPRAAQR